VLESMAWGLPLVATDIPPNREATGDTAVLVPVGDVEGTAGAVSHLLGDAEAARTLGARARDRAAARFSPEAQAQATAALYERLLAAKRRG